MGHPQCSFKKQKHPLKDRLPYVCPPNATPGYLPWVDTSTWDLHPSDNEVATCQDRSTDARSSNDIWRRSFWFVHINLWALGDVGCWHIFDTLLHTAFKFQIHKNTTVIAVVVGCSTEKNASKSDILQLNIGEENYVATLKGTVRPYPTQREVRKIIDSNMPAGWWYGFVPSRVTVVLQSTTQSSWFFSTHLKNMLVNWDPLLRDPSEN